MFYDQFGRLAVYQIVLVSLGVLVLLIGVWVVSAIQPTGQGGVDMGTWVEEEDEEMEFTETSPMLDHDESDRRQSAPPSTTAHRSPTASPPLLTYSQPRPPPLNTEVAGPPQTPVFVESPAIPDSPLSPTSARRRRRTRYGTLVPELAPAGAPTGFSIGLGAASPGFVLRPAGGSFTHHGRGRSRSEDVRGIQAIMRGEHVGQGENEGEAEVRQWDEQGSHPQAQSTRPRRQSWFERITGRRRGPIRLEDEDGAHHDTGEGDGE